MFNVLMDILSGELPIDEVPNFIFWLLGETFWLWFTVIVVGAIILFLG
jgi:hypothetical protein